MRRPNFPRIPGFELFPEGKLLNQVVDFERAMGIAYERCIGYQKPPHTHDRFTVTFPRGSSRSSIKVFPQAAADGKLFKLDESSAHVMPPEMLHEQGSYSAVYDTFAVFPAAKLVENVWESMGVRASEKKRLLSSAFKCRRTALLDDTVSRYFFSRIVAAEKESEESRFLEREILRLVFASALERDVGGRPAEASPENGSSGLARALEYIESNLFEKIDTPAITRHARISQPSLFRHFKKELKQSPFTYIRNRRLDEAAQLLKRGRYTVADVALLVCYEDLSAFSKAFKGRFKRPPSAFLPAR